MNVFPLTYRIPSLLEAPQLHMDLLWGLAAFFAVLGGIYLFLTFWMRNRISAKREAIRLKKRDLAPMISNFLFYQHESEDEDRDTYIAMKIEIRELLKLPLNREVMSEVLMDLRMDVSGDARERLFQLFQDLGLHQDSFRKLESWRWERISKGILELTEMQVEKAYPFIRKFINDRRSVIRKQAQLATVMLREEGITYFLDTAHYSISEWQQLKLLEILRLREDYNPPRFRVWLTSENRDVVLFALRLIRHYRQNDAEKALIKLLGHRNQVVKGAALECIREFRFSSALEPIISLFPRVNEELKLLILDTLALIGSESELGFLNERAVNDRNFIIRSKARAVMNLLKPDSAMPEVPAEDSQMEAEPLETIQKEPPTFPDLELPADSPEENEPYQADTGLLWEPNFVEVSEDQAAEAGIGTYGEAVDADFSGSAKSEDEWEEDVAIFEVCFLEELEDILSELDPAVEPEGILPLDFLPIITEETERAEPGANPAELEVVAEWVVPEASREESKLPRPPDLRENLKEDFLPLIVHDPVIAEGAVTSPPADPPEVNMGGLPGPPIQFWEPIFELDEMPQPAVLPAGEPYFKQVPDFRDNPLERFSIFRELFRQIDADSKLILLKELVEIGEEKEWEFLHELLADSDPRVTRQVSRAIQSLGDRLGLEEAAPQPQIAPGDQEEELVELFGFELDLIGESDTVQPGAEKPTHTPVYQTGNRWLRWAGKPKKQPHE